MSLPQNPQTALLKVAPAADLLPHFQHSFIFSRNNKQIFFQRAGEAGARRPFLCQMTSDLINAAFGDTSSVSALDGSNFPAGVSRTYTRFSRSFREMSGEPWFASFTASLRVWFSFVSTCEHASSPWAPPPSPWFHQDALRMLHSEPSCRNGEQSRTGAWKWGGRSGLEERKGRGCGGGGGIGLGWEWLL